MAVSDYVRGAASLQVRETARRCLSGPEVLVSVLSSLVQDRSVLDTCAELGR